jgi:hypothetical protein
MRHRNRTIAILAAACAIGMTGCTADPVPQDAAKRLACSTVWGDTDCWTSLYAIAAAPARFDKIPVVIEGWMAIHGDRLALFPAETAGAPTESWLSALLVGERGQLQGACDAHCYSQVRVRGFFHSGDDASTSGPRLGRIEVAAIEAIEPVRFDLGNRTLPQASPDFLATRTTEIAGTADEPRTVR